MNSFSFFGRLSGMFLIALLTVASSCSKSPDMVISSAPKAVKLKAAQINASYVCNPQSSPLVSKQKEIGGAVDICVIPASGNILVSVTANSGWSLKSIQMFAGNKENIPLTGKDTPALEDFPVSVNFPTPEVSYSYEFSTKPTSGNQVVVVHAYLRRAVRNGYAGPSEEFWIDGIRFTESKWAMYYNYMLMPCSPTAP